MKKIVTAGDAIALTAVLSDANGAIDLSGSTVVLRCTNIATGTVTQLATTVNDANGNTSASLSSLAAATYDIQWKVTTAGNVRSVPNDDYDRLVVRAAI